MLQLVMFTAFLFQRLHVIIQSDNSALIHDSRGILDLETNLQPFCQFIVNFCFKPFGSLHLRAKKNDTNKIIIIITEKQGATLVEQPCQVQRQE